VTSHYPKSRSRIADSRHIRGKNVWVHIRMCVRVGDETMMVFLDSGHPFAIVDLAKCAVMRHARRRDDLPKRSRSQAVTFINLTLRYTEEFLDFLSCGIIMKRFGTYYIVAPIATEIWGGG